MLGPYAQEKLIDAILHSLWDAGLLEGLQNPADTPLRALGHISIVQS